MQEKDLSYSEFLNSLEEEEIEAQISLAKELQDSEENEEADMEEQEEENNG